MIEGTLLGKLIMGVCAFVGGFIGAYIAAKSLEKD